MNNEDFSWLVFVLLAITPLPRRLEELNLAVVADYGLNSAQIIHLGYLVAETYDAIESQEEKFYKELKQ